MAEDDAVRPADGDGVTGPDGRTDDGLTADPDDEFFAVVDADVLRALVDVHEHGLDDALAFVDEGSGLRVRGNGGENCYWMQTRVPVEAFDRFQVEDLRAHLDVSALGASLADARRGERVSLHYADERGLRLGVGPDRHDVGGDDPEFAELSEEMRERDGLSGVEDALPETSFELDAARLQALVGVETDHTHVRLDSDIDAGTATLTFVGGPGEPGPAFEVRGDEFVTPPASTGMGADPDGGLEGMLAASDEEFDEDTVTVAKDIFGSAGPETATSYLCVESVRPAMEPMRGPVRVLHSDRRDWTRFTYERAEGALDVTALVAYRLDEVDDLP